MTKSDTGFGLSQIGQISITVHNIERATKFYRDVLGMNFLFSVPKMAFFSCGEARLMLAVPEKAEFDHPASIIYYRVANIHDSHKILSSRGVQFETDPHLVHKAEDHELWMAFFRDTEGNLLALMSEMPSV